jgi:tRNA(Arg) A34 adenosine deaminase TadA
MKQALEMRTQALDAGDQGYGAVVVKNEKIVGLGPSRVIVNHDPTAHAEIEAIRDASRRLATRNLSGCTLYATFTPCLMCQTAAYWGNVDKVIVGEGLKDVGKPEYGC